MAQREDTDITAQHVARVVAIARRAGAEILARVAARTRPDRKSDGSPVTDCDRIAHEVIVSELTALDPSIPIVSEESIAPSASERRGWTRFWLVDPLDGTKEFVEGLPDYTVNIALIDHGEPVLGVVFAPARDTLYYAARQLGSWRVDGDGSPVRIFARPPAPGTPLRTVESRSHRSADLDAFAVRWHASERVAVGSSLKFCWLAEGRADVYPRFTPIMEWDVAAGDCVFRYTTAGAAPHYSPLTYNGTDLRLSQFVVGFTPPAPAVVWLTGLPGAGKTTIARLVRDRLARMGSPVELLDGDDIRAVFPNTGFSREDRDAHIRRVGYMASRLERHGVTSLAALVSPYRESREFVRRQCGRFIEVYISTPLDECERRDPKGLYRRARAGEVAQLTGVGSAYEPPAAAELVLDTRGLSADEAADRVMEQILSPADPV